MMGSYHRSIKTNIPQSQIHDGSFMHKRISIISYIFISVIYLMLFMEEMYRERDNRQQQHIHAGSIELEDGLIVTIEAS